MSSASQPLETETSFAAVSQMRAARGGVMGLVQDYGELTKSGVTSLISNG